jgi:type I restriction enzyme S subunit
MSSEWRTVRVGDLGRIVTGKTPRTTIKENFGGKIPFLTPSDDMSAKYVRKTKRTLSEQGVAEVAGKVLPANSIAVSCIGSNLGKVTITTTETVTNQQINSIIPFESYYDTDFVYYAIKILGERLNFLSKTSTAVPIINKTQFSNETIRVPPLPIQKAISGTLACLDAKIEINNRITANLEQQAQAIFKNWFVDFEPFRNGESIDSDLGMIPKGWRVGKLGELGTIVGGATPRKSNKEFYEKQGIPWITPKDLSIQRTTFVSRGEVDISEKGLENSGVKLIPRGAVLFSSRAPIGYMAIAKNPLGTNQGFKSVVPLKEFGTPFIYNLLRAYLPRIQALGSGSTFKEVSGSVMRSVPVIVPDLQYVQNYNALVQPMYDLIETLESENQILAALRDTLLPKLMSGEIEVPVV